MRLKNHISIIVKVVGGYTSQTMGVYFACRYSIEHKRTGFSGNGVYRVCVQKNTFKKQTGT